MSQTFTCPNCTANLEHDGGNHLTVQCPYCNSTVIVPDELRPRAHRQDFAPLLAQQTALREVVRLINSEEGEQAAQVYQDAFQVDAATAADAVQRLAAGLSLANQHVYTMQLGQQTKVRRRGGCLLTGLIALIVLGIAAAVIVPLVGGMAALLAFLPGFEAESPNVSEIISAVSTAVPAANGAEVEVMLTTVAVSGSDNVEAVLTAVAESGGGDAEVVLTAVAESLADTNTSNQPENISAIDTLFAIGERGINPGQFNDARALAVNREGIIYVADRESGRLQTFAADGTYQTTLPWDKEKFTDDLEIGPDGTLYAQQSSRLFRYNADSAELLGEIVYTQDNAVSFSNMALAVNGDLLAINRVRNSIIRFDGTGNVLQTISIESVPSALGFENLAVDGLGNIYVTGTAEDVLGDRQNVVFKFSTEGQFASQFGSDGNEPGLFLGIVSAIALDGQGHIYVADFQGVQMFDNNGRFLDLIPIEGAARDMAFTNQSELVVITSEHKLYKFDVSGLGN